MKDYKLYTQSYTSVYGISLFHVNTVWEELIHFVIVKGIQNPQ